jgi:hypothetical protein
LTGTSTLPAFGTSVPSAASTANVPLQGSGTFSVEAAIGTLVPKTGKVLVPVNGAYCQRIVRILGYLGRAAVTIDVAEDRHPTAQQIDAALTADPTITHVAQVHCETGTGILNPLAEIAQVVARHGKGLIVDAMSSFGALPIDVRSCPFDALIAASGKCLEGVPGMGLVIAKKDVLERSAGNSHSLAMDLYDQYVYMQKTTQWRFTPPTHVVADVEVDRKTGKVRVTKFHVAHDCGQIINPDGLRNQIEGNVVQTVSRTLLEDLQFDRGAVTSLDWRTYPILTFPDVPEVVIDLIDRPGEKPWGAGEPTAAVVPSAIANAIYDATGARLRSVPFVPDKVLAAMKG